MKQGEEMAARARAAQMQQTDQMQQQQEQKRQEAEARQEQRRSVVRSVLEPEALERLNRIGLVKPEKQQRLEELILANVQRGGIRQKIDEGTFVNLLHQIEKAETSSTIQFKRRAFDDDSDIDLDNLEERMSTIQGFFARAGMKTVEQFEKLKQDAEKSFGIEAELDDPVLKEVQNIMVEEEDALVQIAKMSNELIDSVTVVAKRDASDMLQFMRTLVENRGTKEQKYRILGQIDEYATIHEETTSGEDAIANWLVLELQANVLNQVAKHLTRNTHIREKFWRVKELKRQVGLLGKISSIDKKSKTELAVAQADFSELEKELIDQLQAMKDTGVATVDAIWNEYIRIEAEYYTKMNDAYLEPSTPRPVKAPLGEVRTSKEVHIASPEIGEAEDEMEQ